RPVAEEGNAYFALSAAMVLAAADFRDGKKAAAIDHLRPLAGYIRSDSANWRMARYCRSFPELLGLLAQTVGAEQLPIHMLRMVLPENAERGLKLAVDTLPKGEWTILGQRVLGEEQFEAYVQRQGRPMCRIHLFGGLDVTAGDRVVSEKDWKKRKARLLFAMLVVRRGQDVPRDQILDHLWPDLSEDKAKNNFYVAWSMMKSALMPPEERDKPCPYVENSRGRCRIVREAVRSDVDEFEELLGAARQAEAAGKIDEAVAALQQLMSVYRGELLPGDVYDDWFSPLRDKYRFDFVDAMMRGAELLLEQDDPCEALVFARRAISVDRYREDLYQMALRCHIAAGQRGAAIETFIRCKTELAEELGLDPTVETMALYQQVLAMEERPRYDSYGLS
ncbi:MAG TPA: bacterial transcriptional activator domain-containing protein, partial [Coriobacteriia bacterium]|nr:bacterial transcriptional activator domain-containing protein [Coriobacteriia bacterium]